VAQRNEKVFERVREELAKNSGAGSRDLYEVVREADKSLTDSLQQFHARYVLPIKREAAARGGSTAKTRRARKQPAAPKSAAPARATGRTRGTRKAEATREHVRGVLLQFAQDFAATENKADVVALMSRLDEYVDRIGAARR